MSKLSYELPTITISRDLVPQRGLYSTLMDTHRVMRKSYLEVAKAHNKVADKLARELVSVRDFGAVGDGVTDDTVAIQAALDTGRAVFIPSGMVCLVSGLTISVPGTELHGPGAIKLKDLSDVAVITVSANSVKIVGVEIDGNKINQSATINPPTTTAEAEGAGIHLTDGVSKCNIIDCYIHDTRQSGVGCWGNHSEIVVSRCRIDNVGFIGIRPSQDSGRLASRCVFSENVINSPGQDGIGVVAIADSVIKGNIISGHVVAGIALEANNQRLTVVGNTVLNGATGIQLNDCWDISVVGNVVRDCTGNGIVISGGPYTDNILVSANTVVNCGSSADAGINLSTSEITSYKNPRFSHIVVSGNTIKDSPRAGILLSSLGGVIITSNLIHNINTSGDAVTKRRMGGIVLRHYAHYNVVSDNVVLDDTGGNFKVGIYETQDSGQPSLNRIVNNQIRGFIYDILTTLHNTDQSHVERVNRYTSAPTAGNWQKGDIVYHAYPSAGGYIGWVCTTSGTFGSFSTTGTGTAGSYQITLASTAGLHDGMKLNITDGNGAGVDAQLAAIRVNHSTGVVDLNAPLGNSVTDTTVTLANPTFKQWGAITP